MSTKTFLPLKLFPAAALAFGLSGAALAQAPEADMRAEWESRIAALEHRASLVRDSNDIKRLQRAYGYYFSKGLWDEAADLFAPSGTLEFALDGLYAGRERVRDYLHAFGGGETGLPHGRLHEQLQIMPMVHVAADGDSARARWRAIILDGQLGEYAHWGEGPYLADYVKQDGVWKIGALHWFASVVAPYETGWAPSPDPTEGRFVTTLTPDAPPSVDYEPWPGVHLPDFHFRDAAGRTTTSHIGFDELPSAPDIDPADAAPFDALARRAAVLEQEIKLIEAENAAETLQRQFGFYIDKNLWPDAAALFAEDGTIEWAGSGVYAGRDRVLDLLRSFGAEGPQQGVLNDRMQLMPLVHVAPDGLSARGRFQAFNQLARHGEWARWETGIYDTDFVNEGGVWKIAAMRYVQTMAAPYEDGWGVSALPLPAAPNLPPDHPPSVDYEPYPSAFVPPFHFENPVTGGPVFPGDPADHADAHLAADSAALLAQLDSLERRATALEDIEALENLNAVYGYYLAHNQWDSFADIFAEDGTIEIAMRGVYVGRDAVRRNLELYGQQGGEQHGRLHNHMQFQPVITLAPDGQTARMRSRAFSIMGEFGTYQQWMAGVYENTFSKIDGEWVFQTDQVFNTYFSPYDLGWRDLPMRDPPGITDSNPPDLPPSHPFVLYPAPFLPPFHYPNPVTGEPTLWRGAD